MTKSATKTISLEEIRAMKDRGELMPTAPWAEPGDELGQGFWEQAPEIDYHPPTSVHLKLDPFVFDYFKAQGKGHITRMQNVLKAYVLAHTGKR